MTDSSFKPVSWAHTSNIYSVNLRQYTTEGSFAAFEKALPRLQAMGVEILWFMPITPIAVEGRKGSLGSYYACSSYTRTNPEYGSLADFKKLVQTAHQLGMKVIIDWVANHTGKDHEWTKSHPAFYKQNQDGQFYDANGWDDVIDLNYDNHELWAAMVQAMSFWIDECAIDGFRCDMAMLVPLEFWRFIRSSLEERYGSLFWLAECEEAEYHQVFDATYTWRFLHKMEAYMRGECGISGLDEVLQGYNHEFPGTAFRSFFTSNHDENSHSGSEYERLGPAAKAFAVLCATWHNSIPMVYSGQELPNYKRLAFFDRDTIEWNGKYELHDFYATLLSLRQRHPAMRSVDASVKTHRLDLQAEGIFAFLRQKENSSVLVVLNLTGNTIWWEMKDARGQGSFQNTFTGEQTAFNPGTWFEMHAWDYWVFEN